MDGAVPIWFEVAAYIFVVALLAIDFVVVHHRPHVPSMRESALWVAFYSILAIAFGFTLMAFAGADSGGEFFAGWLTEYSLSIDNLFVFIVIMARFAVPKKLQQEVLMVGIVIALVLRGIFIIVGAALIANFVWIFWIFGGFLLYTAFHQAFRSHDDEEETENKLIGFLRKRITMSEHYDGLKIRTTWEGKRVYTPMLVVLLTIAATDVLFAFDSIPAIFGITTNAFIVFTANVFALMGLRQLYFLLGGLLERLVYLKYGIAFILAFIGVKLMLHALHDNQLPFINGGHHIEWVPDIPTWLSLLVIVASMAVATVASLFHKPQASSAK
jgi:tellurite resistance protein TerC